MVKGLKVNSETGEEEVKKLMKDIGTKIRVEGVKRVGKMREGREGMFLMTLGYEEEKFEVMGEKKLLKGKSERIEEDLIWQERRRKWLIEQRAWAERRKGNKVKIGRDRIWVNGVMRIWDEEIEELRTWQTTQGKEKDKEQVNTKEGNESGFTNYKKGVKRKPERENGLVKVAFWNFSALKNKDKGFSGEVTKWDVIMMSEIWADEKDWKGMKRMLRKGSVWTLQEAKEEHIKGRGMGGMVSGVRKELAVKEGKEGEREDKNGTMVIRLGPSISGNSLIKSGDMKRGSSRKERGRGRNKKMGTWEVDKLKEVKENMEKEKIRLIEEEGVDSLMERWKGSIEKVRDELGIKTNREGEKRGWWVEECKESKERMKKCVRKRRTGGMEKGEYNRRKREHERLLERKKQRDKEKYKEEIEKAIREGWDWDVTNKERGGKKGVNEEIELNCAKGVDRTCGKPNPEGWIVASTS
ncbi:eukaryotic translation initiation factor 5B-like [Belonocnema kinseyi]|uniref:eukaryotic translation initiation factor 5B-like n=1 Tax=Belonocnema kinseyi TaxID=2817044 RepID=UPI00143D2994|nr:eukaryotic translation initiation factor 5B-like [Belonocnema kinseyi]